MPLRAVDFESNAPDTQIQVPQQVSESHQPVLPSCFPFPEQIPLDLATIVKAWPSLPPHIRAAVLALVNTGGPRP